MKKGTDDIEKYTRQSVFTKLKPFDYFADNDAFIEITEWKNMEGFDVEIQSTESTRFYLTYGEFDALKQIVEVLAKETNKT